MSTTQLVDSFGRRISYLRLSVTDRCDFRCGYCMNERMTFLPRNQILSFEEIETLVKAFTELGVGKVRVTGGEPLVRKDVINLLGRLGAIDGLKELVLTSNGSQLAEQAAAIKAAGVQRINISLDAVDADIFSRITRRNSLQQVLDGIEAARRQFKRIKLNSVIMRGINDDQILPLLEFARDSGLDISYIEEMPLGDVTTRALGSKFMSSAEIRKQIEQRFTLVPTTESSGGPARYFYIEGDRRTRIGFISPHSHNFCSSCNRVRVTAEGKLIHCLGDEGAIDLKPVLRTYPGNTVPVKQLLLETIRFKPEQHTFQIRDGVQVIRFMNMTGG